MRPSPPWPDLPTELLCAITEFLLSNPSDILRFRAVCKLWFASLSLPLNFLSPPCPLRVSLPPPALRPRFYSSFDSPVLSATSVYALRPLAGVPVDDSSVTPTTWLVFIDQLNPGNVSIRRPLTKWNFPLPLDFPRKLNLLDVNVSEIGRYYNLSFVYGGCGKLNKPRVWSEEVLKVVVFDNESAVVVLSDEGKLGLLRLGKRDNVVGSKWEIIHDGKDFLVDDIVDYKGRILGIDRRGRVYEMGYCSRELNVTTPPITGEGVRRKRLIESLGFLHLVVGCNDYRVMEEMGKYKVYVLNEEMREWVEVASIRDQIFFFGLDFSISVSSEECDGSCGKNCIFFNELSFRKYDGGYDDSWLFFKSRHNAVHFGLYHLEDGTRLPAIELYPHYSNVLWPPPTWLWQ